MRPPHALLALLLAAVVVLPLPAQRDPRASRTACDCAAPGDSLAIGTPLRLRVRPAPGSPFAPDGPAVRVGTFAGWRADTLLVRFRRHGAPAAVPPAALRSLDRGIGRRRSVGGMIAGSVGGLALGVTLGALLASLDRGGCGESPCDAGPAALGGAAGMVLGAAAGFERGTPRWVPVALR